MENRIARFLFGRSMKSKFGDAITMKSIGSLATAVVEINGLFLHSKNILRTHVVSIYAGGDEESIDMDPVRSSSRASPPLSHLLFPRTRSSAHETT
jgi:hypothetical protein